MILGHPVDIRVKDELKPAIGKDAEVVLTDGTDASDVEEEQA